jgi:hypothetical protein
MGFFNDSGLITLGFGRRQRIITQGYGSSFEVGGRRIQRNQEIYNLEIKIPIKKANKDNVLILIPILKNYFQELKFIVGIIKKEEIEIKTKFKIDNKKLFEILDQI